MQDVDVIGVKLLRYVAITPSAARMVKLGLATYTVVE